LYMVLLRKRSVDQCHPGTGKYGAEIELKEARGRLTNRPMVIAICRCCPPRIIAKYFILAYCLG
jgi:hypothetical protein